VELYVTVALARANHSGGRRIDGKVQTRGGNNCVAYERDTVRKSRVQRALTNGVGFQLEVKYN
jgi:hypothetical protein